MTTTSKRLLIYTTKDIVDFGEATLHVWQKLGGVGEVYEGREITSTELPEHDAILIRFGVPYTSIHYKALKDHVAAHGCLCVNEPITMAFTSNKARATEMASQVMTIPKSRVITRDMNLEDALEGFTFPLVLKPKFSNGGRNIFFYRDKKEVKDYMKDEMCDHRYEATEWLVQECVDFEKLVRCVYMDGKLIDAVYDTATEPYKIRLKLGHLSKVWPEGDRAQLEEACKKLAEVFKMQVMVVDFFVTRDGKLVFNEVNNATNLKWLRRHSEVPHATLLAKYVKRLLDERCEA